MLIKKKKKSELNNAFCLNKNTHIYTKKKCNAK